MIYPTKAGYIINPITGRQIKINGPTYNELINSGIIAKNITPKIPSPSKMPSPPKIPSPSKTKKIPSIPTLGKAGRKSPAISATKLPVGTEQEGLDGLYIIRLRANGSQYWAKCANKGSNCQTGGGQKNRSQKSRGQTGGNPIVMALPALADLAIPGGLTAMSYMANKYLHPKEQRGGGGRCGSVYIPKYHHNRHQIGG